MTVMITILNIAGNPGGPACPPGPARPPALAADATEAIPCQL